MFRLHLRFSSTGTRRTLACAVLFVLALLLRASFGGIYYEPILDDTVQYILYPTSVDYGALIAREGMFSSRPLAALTDLFVVGRMENLFFAVILMAVMHGISCVLFQRVLSRFFSVGPVFAVIYTLLPLGCEGTYWLSAATRVVSGLFFTACAAAVLCRFIDAGKWWRVPLYFLLELLSFGFYEQILVLSFTLSGLIFLRYWRERRAALSWLAFLCAGIYFGFTAHFAADSPLSDRMELIFPDTPYYFNVFLPDLARQIGMSFLSAGVRTTFVGFWRGLAACFTGGIGGWLYGFAAAGLAVWYGILHWPRRCCTVVSVEGWVRALLWGLLLFLAPITPFFVIARPYFSLRSTVPSFVGAAILIDLFFRALIRRRRAMAAVSGAMVFVCLLGCASEIGDYKATAREDRVLAQAILERESEFYGRVGFLGVKEFPVTEQNYPYHEHVASVAAADWTLTAKLAAAKGTPLSFDAVPLTVEEVPFYRLWNRDVKRIGGFDQLWLWENGELIPLAAERIGEQDYRLYYPDGTLWAEIREEGEFGYLERGIRIE